MPTATLRRSKVQQLFNQADYCIPVTDYKQLALINQLDEDEKNALVKIINSMLTKKRMKDLLDGKIKLAM